MITGDTFNHSINAGCRCSRRRSNLFARAVTLLMLVGLAISSPVRLLAAGSESTRRQQDIVLSVDSRWAGVRFGGYYPIRIQAINKGPTCDLRLVFAGTDSSSDLPTVEQTVTVEQNATVRFTLSVPLVGRSSYGELVVYRNGRELTDLRSTHALADIGRTYGMRPSLLVIDPDVVDCNQFEIAANSIGKLAASTGHHYGSSTSEDHMVVSPLSLPESWIDYSGLDIIAVSLEHFGDCTPAAREAILKWVDAGGNLIVTEIEKGPKESTDLRRFLSLSVDDARKGWDKANPGRRNAVRIFDTATENEIAREFAWESSEETYVYRDRMLGRIYAFSINPFPGKAGDWAWLLDSLTPPHWQWTMRHGLSARSGSNEFLKFLIPGVGGVPIVAFLVLITMFTIVIGPLNYVLLWRKKQLYLLVITIPVIAFTTTFALAGYAMISDGFGVKSRVMSYTLLDQANNSAVAINRVSLYAGMAPSAGLKFSPETVVLPFWPQGDTLRGGRVDWTNNDQQLTGGWLRSRTRTQFVTASHRAERGRLTTSTSNGTLTASNGFAWDFDVLLVVSTDGNLYLGEDVPAGASARLKPIEPADFLKEYRDLLQAHPLNIPEGAEQRHMYYSPYDDGVQADFNVGLLRRGITAPLNLLGNQLPPGTFVAVTRQNPGTEVGLTGASESASLHVIRGELTTK